jgi:hypothetical protein
LTDDLRQHRQGALPSSLQRHRNGLPLSCYFTTVSSCPATPAALPNTLKSMTKRKGTSPQRSSPRRNKTSTNAAASPQSQPQSVSKASTSAGKTRDQTGKSAHQTKTGTPSSSTSPAPSSKSTSDQTSLKSPTPPAINAIQLQAISNNTPLSRTAPQEKPSSQVIYIDGRQQIDLSDALPYIQSVCNSANVVVHNSMWPFLYPNYISDHNDLVIAIPDSNHNTWHKKTGLEITCNILGNPARATRTHENKAGHDMSVFMIWSDPVCLDFSYRLYFISMKLDFSYILYFISQNPDSNRV